MVIPPNVRDEIRERWLPKGGFKGPTIEQAVSVLGAFMLGATTTGAANFAGVGVSTLRNWRKKDPKFDLACAEGCAYANRQVVYSLFCAATVPDHNGKINVSACIFWLKNRAKDEWADIITAFPPPGEGDVPKVPLTDERLTAVSEVLHKAGVITDAKSDEETLH